MARQDFLEVVAGTLDTWVPEVDSWTATRAAICTTQVLGM